MFAILDVNLQWVPASRNVEKGIALNIGRFIEVPLILMIAAEMLNSQIQVLKRWGIALAICLFITIDDWLYLSTGIVEYRKWNYILAFLDYGLFIVVMAWIARWFIHINRGGNEQA